MTPPVGPTSSHAESPDTLVPVHLLQDGEIVILAIKPCNWFVLVASLPVLASAGVVAGAGAVLGLYQAWVPVRTVGSVCLIVALGRALLACWQWLGTTYVLTNRRIVTVRGLLAVRWMAAGLTEICQAALTATLPERLVGSGSIDCLTDPDGLPVVSWRTIPRPGEIHEIVQEALRRAHRR